jgi:RNA polymerase sigma factor (sigma-70 family)
MTSGSSADLQRQFRTLFGAGAVGSLPDGQLLDRFASRRDDEGAEAAFTALVERHGPMVLRVCRGVLGDVHEAQDAFQAVFLVLARKAGSIRERDTVGPWLHGVATRVSAKAKARAARRRAHDRKAAERAGPHSAQDAELSWMWAELHEEVDRLPETYRAPVVLCYLEGLTNEEAAGRLRWPVGTVKVRLSRARDRLRRRLSRRGLAPAVGLLGAATASDAAALPPTLVDLTVRAAMGRAANGAVAATALSLAEEALRTMMLAKLKLGALGMLSIAAVTIGAGGLLDQDGAKPGPKASPARGKARDAAAGPVDQAKPGPKASPATGKVAPAEDDIATMRRRLVETARQRLETQKAFYEEGRITIDRYIDAIEKLLDAERLVATTDAARRAALERYVTRVEDVLHREQTELGIGRGTKADVAEVQFHLDAAKLRLLEEAAVDDPGSRRRDPSHPTEPRRDAGPKAESKLPAKLRGDYVYVVEPPDLLTVEVLEALPGRPISGERLVRPDGTISLGFYGDVEVAGLTLPEIKEKVVRHLRKFLPDEALGLAEVDDNGTPDDPSDDKTTPVDPRDSTHVFVDVSAYNSKVYYVQGAVASPGRIPVTGNDTVLDAIQYAGGLLPIAESDKVRLIRRGAPGQPDVVMPVNYEEITAGTDRSTNYDLMPGDRLAVPYQKAKSPEPPDRGEPDRPAARADGGAVERRLDALEKKLDRLIHLPDGKPRERGSGTYFDRRPGSSLDRPSKD